MEVFFKQNPTPQTIVKTITLVLLPSYHFLAIEMVQITAFCLHCMKAGRAKLDIQLAAFPF
jgi:hypothetical protein